MAGPARASESRPSRVPGRARPERIPCAPPGFATRGTLRAVQPARACWDLPGGAASTGTPCRVCGRSRRALKRPDPDPGPARRALRGSSPGRPRGVTRGGSTLVECSERPGGAWCRTGRRACCAPTLPSGTPGLGLRCSPGVQQPGLPRYGCQGEINRCETRVRFGCRPFRDGDPPQVRPPPRARDPRGSAGLDPSARSRHPRCRGCLGERVPRDGPGAGATSVRKRCESNPRPAPPPLNMAE